MLTEEEKQHKLELQTIRRFKKRYGVTPKQHDILTSKGNYCKLCKCLPKTKHKVLQNKLVCDKCYPLVKVFIDNPNIINQLLKLQLT